MRIVIALPTIEERGDAWKDVAQAWIQNTPQPVATEPSWRKPTWAAGLNEVWENHPDAELFICGSDDMTPEKGWFEAVLPWLGKGIIAPQVHDPRFSRWDASTADGTETRMSSFPIIAGEFLSSVFPLPPELHYYSDDLISDKARKAGIPTIAVPSCVIHHSFDERGRGAGMGSEEARMAHDRAIYRAIVTNRNSVSNP